MIGVFPQISNPTNCLMPKHALEGLYWLLN